MAKKTTRTRERTWIEINKKALIHNVSELKKLLPKKCRAMFVVKANAYGHGLPEVVSVLKNDKDIDVFGVFSFEDALYIRSQTKKPVVVLCTLDKSWIPEATKYNIELTISHIDQLLYLRKKSLSKKLKVHLKVDTGLGRQGFLKSDIHKVCGVVHNMKQIDLVGLYTHLSGAESRTFDEHTVKQYNELLEWKHALGDIGLHPLCHISATSGVMRMHDLAENIVRFGIGTYGLWPSMETLLANRGKTKLNPVLSWRTKVVETKELPAGSYIAYDLTCKLTKKTKIAILPVGYWDGLPRQASGHAWVLIKGKRCQVLGRIMMNMCVVDASSVLSVKPGDAVTIIGNDGKETISAEALSHASGTINYEIVTRINPLIPRLLA